MEAREASCKLLNQSCIIRLKTRQAVLEPRKCSLLVNSQCGIPFHSVLRCADVTAEGSSLTVLRLILCALFLSIRHNLGGQAWQPRALNNSRPARGAQKTFAGWLSERMQGGSVSRPRRDPRLTVELLISKAFLRGSEVASARLSSFVTAFSLRDRLREWVLPKNGEKHGREITRLQAPHSCNGTDSGSRLADGTGHWSLGGCGIQ